MPRSEKEAFDWSLTYSPENDSEVMPGWYVDLVNEGKVSHFIAITERHTIDDKWHVHIAFRLKRSYKSDYKWWERLTKDRSPELDIRYHNNLRGLAGGYLAKSEPGNFKVIARMGFTDACLENGKLDYIKGQKRKRIHDAVQDIIGIHPGKWIATRGFIIRDTGCTEEEADAVAAQLGFASQASKASEAVYGALYLDKERARQLL